MLFYSLRAKFWLPPSPELSSRDPIQNLNLPWIVKLPFQISAPCEFKRPSYGVIFSIEIGRRGGVGECAWWFVCIETLKELLRGRIWKQTTTLDEVIAILDAAEAGLEQIIGFTVCRKVDLPPKQERKLLYLVLWRISHVFLTWK